jgi:hypothetical protein
MTWHRDERERAFTVAMLVHRVPNAVRFFARADSLKGGLRWT